MNKLIIDNRTRLTDFDAIMLVGEIIRDGRISNFGRQYRYMTRIKIKNKEYIIHAGVNKCSDRFVITN